MSNSDRPTYLWSIEDHVVTGTLAAYAKDVEASHYVDATVGPLYRPEVGTEGVVSLHPVEVERIHRGDADDYSYWGLKVGETEFEGYQIDLRA